MDDRSLQVEHALLAVSYRVHPETPLAEVVDLIVRREIGAVPVVGESDEVLGVITAKHALDHVLRMGPADAPETDPEELTARDVMTRTVLCVSEDQSLLDAANTMVNRDVEQLPVVREGEFIGFVTRETILRILHGGTAGADDEENEEES